MSISTCSIIISVRRNIYELYEQIQLQQLCNGMSATALELLTCLWESVRIEKWYDELRRSVERSSVPVESLFCGPAVPQSLHAVAPDDGLGT